jgi:hypothetical protein
MNKIVREHYPASELPENLRVGIAPDARVTVEVTVEPPGAGLSFRALFDSLKEQRITEGDPVARVRELRDEWRERPVPESAGAD